MSGGSGAEPEADLAGPKSLYDAVVGRCLHFDFEGWAGTAEGILPSWIVLDDLYGRFKLAILDRVVADVIVAAVAAEDAVGFQNGHAAIPIGIGLTAYRNVSKFDNVKTLNLRHDPLLLCPHRKFRGAISHIENAKSGDTDHIPGDEGIENGIYHGLHRLPRRSLV